MMVIYTYQRGHRIYFNEKEGDWHYCDDDTPATIERPCAKCGKMPTSEGYDACIGKVDGAKSACCGHGVTEPILIKPRIVYEEVNDCTDCLYNQRDICYRLGKYLHDICFEKDCPLPLLGTVEQYLRYIDPDDEGFEVCGNCQHWEYLGYFRGYGCDIGFCFNDEVDVEEACECTRKGCEKFKKV